MNFCSILLSLSLSSSHNILQVLIEKLLYSCSELKQILILVRPKKGKSPESRIEDMFKIPVSWKRIIPIHSFIYFRSFYVWSIFLFSFFSYVLPKFIFKSNFLRPLWRLILLTMFLLISSFLLPSLITVVFCMHKRTAHLSSRHIVQHILSLIQIANLTRSFIPFHSVGHVIDFSCRHSYQKNMYWIDSDI